MDTLSLLFELDTDPSKAVAGFRRARAEFAKEIEAMRKSVAQSFTLPPIKLPTTTQASARGNQIDAHVKEFQRLEAEAAKSAKALDRAAVSAQELANRQTRADQATSRLAQGQQRLAASAELVTAAQQRAANAIQRAANGQTQAAAGAVRAAAANQRAANSQAQAAAGAIRAAAAHQQANLAVGRAGVAVQQLANQQTRAVQTGQRLQQNAQRLTINNNQLAVASQRAANAQVQASAGAIRAATSYQRATVAANTFARSQVGVSRAMQNLLSSIRDIGPGLQSLGRGLTIGITAPLLALGAAGLKSAKDLDANVNTLRAFTGSAEAAEKRLAQLIKTARDTPGLTTNLALTLDAQLRVAKTTEETINRVLPAIGRLNAVSKLPDAGRFTQNLLQLVTQNFERQDLKELVGQSPIAGQLLTEIFNVDSPTNAKAIREQAKKLGLTTVDAFFAAFADAAAANQGLATVTESIGTRFEKVVDRVTVALRPLGLAIINAIEPFVEPIAGLVERVGAAFDSLPGPIKTAVVVIAGLAATAGPVLFIFGGLLQSIGQIIPALVALNAIGLLPTLTNLRLIGQVMAGTASLAAGATATAAVATAGWIALAGALALVGFAIFKYVTAEEKLVKISKEQIDTQRQQIQGLQDQAKFLAGLKTGVQRTANEQQRLEEIYRSLNVSAAARVEGISDEEKRLLALRAELEKIIKVRQDERVSQAAALAGSLASTLAGIDANEREAESITSRLQVNERLVQAIEQSNKVSADQVAILKDRSVIGKDLIDTDLDAARAIRILREDSAAYIAAQRTLRDTTNALNGTAQEQSDTLTVLQRETGLTARQLLTAAKSWGVLRTDVDSALKNIEAFRARQGEATAATKESTKEIDEQTKSLKELKRALKEAEIATRQRSAATRRAFEEDRISSQEATRQLIADARQLAAAQIKEIDETLQAKEKEAESADDETKLKLLEEIADLRLKKTQILSETITEVADLQAQQRRREREGEQEHQATLIEIRRTSADEQIAVLRDRIEREESFRLQGEQQIVVIERRVTQAEEDEIRRRLELVAEGTEARRRLEDELAKFIADKARQRAEQARRLARAELDAALLPVRRQRLQEPAESAGDAGVISRLQAIADEGRASFEATERQVGKIIDQGFERRIKRLRDEIKIKQQHNQDVSEQNAELRTLEQERQNSLEETDREIERARQADLDRARSYRDQLKSIYAGVAEITLELRERVINALRRGLAPERQIIDEENKLALAREELRHTQVTGEIRENIDRLEALQKRRALNAQELRELKAHREALKAESDLHKSNQEEIERQRRIDLERANPNSTRSLFGDTFADFGEAIRSAAAAADVAISNLTVTLGSFGAAAAEHFANASAQAGNFVSILLDGISQINAGLGDMLQNWILTGETGSGALRKLLASTLAYYSRTFLIKALDNIGEGFSNLAKASASAAAFDYRGAALYSHAATQNFISAAKYGLASAATAVAGRFAAGDSFKQRDTASRAINGGGDAEPRNRTFSGQGVESSSTAAREGSGGGIFGQLVARIERLQQQNLDVQRQQQLHNAQVAQALTKLGTARPGDVVTVGAQERPDSIGVAVVTHSNSSGDFNETLQRNLGFA